MGVRDERRTEVLDRVARHLLAAGLPGSSLRSLAAAAEVSDRMLLYYFADKAEVLTLALSQLARDMALVLDRSVPAAPKRAFAPLLREIRVALASPVLRPFMHLWLEIASRAARHEPPYADLAGAIAEGFRSWIAMRLDAASEAECALMLAAVEGLVLLDAIGRRDLADAAMG
jgi:AcrR family transcriptional regulator